MYLPKAVAGSVGSYLMHFAYIAASFVGNIFFAFFRAVVFCGGDDPYLKALGRNDSIIAFGKLFSESGKPKIIYR